MSFQDYLKANYTQQEIAAMSREGLASRRVMFDQAEKRKDAMSWDRWDELMQSATRQS